MKLVTRTDKEWEKIVYAEVLIPNQPNVYGDIWLATDIKNAADAFSKNCYGIDINHDNVDRSDSVKVIDSFIAEESDEILMVDSWVWGIYIDDDEIWQRVLNGEINGFSYEALLEFNSAILTYEDDGIRTGLTEPSTEDGHVHEFYVEVDDNNRPVFGGTNEVNDHSHSISTHSVRDESYRNVHRFNLVTNTRND